MYRPTLLISSLVLLTASSGAAMAGDAEAGKAKAGMCAACHGAAGEGMEGNDMWPKLAGQKEGYLKKQIQAFRDGSREDPVMSPMAKPLTDEDVENLAAYYSSL